MKLLVGLGNPGAKYDQTRHNAGFWFVDAVARRLGVSLREEKRFHGICASAIARGQKLMLLEPTTFMNASGRAVAAIAQYYSIEPEAILVAHDEIDLPPGTIRLKRGGGHAGHNGLRDIIPALSSREFARLRIGVGHPGSKEQVVGYVLARAAKTEQQAIEASIDRAAEALDWLLDGDLARAMNEINRSSS